MNRSGKSRVVAATRLSTNGSSVRGNKLNKREGVGRLGCAVEGRPGRAAGSENGGLGARRGGHVIGVYVGDVGRRRAQARAKARRRVRRQPLLQVLQRRLEGAHHAQLQPNQAAPPPSRRLPVPRPPAALARTIATDIQRVWCGCSCYVVASHDYGCIQSFATLWDLGLCVANMQLVERPVRGGYAAKRPVLRVGAMLARLNKNKYLKRCQRKR